MFDDHQCKTMPFYEINKHMFACTHTRLVCPWGIRHGSIYFWHQNITTPLSATTEKLNYLHDMGYLS